jgi:ABC-2 type transport system permease protein
MRSAFAVLTRLYFRSIYGWKPLSEYKRPRDWLKLAGAILLGLFILGDFGFIFVASAIAQYQALKPQGLEGLLLLNASIMSTMIVFVFGFIMALSTYSLSAAEQQLLALPIRPRAFLGAKFVVVYLSEFAFSLFLMGVNLAVFGLREAPPLAFYLCGLVVALAIPLLPLAIAYFIIVPIMSLARFMRNKNTVLMAVGVIGLVFALAFNIWIQGSMTRLSDPGWILHNYAGPGTVLNLVGSSWPPSLVAWEALAAAAAGRWPEGLALALGLAVAGTAVAALVATGLGGVYGRSLLDFGEGVLKKLGRSETADFIGRGFARKGALRALFLRENRLMNREPIYFLNGPFIVILMPVILVIMYFVQRSNFAELAGAVEGLRGGPAGLLIGAGFGAFLGSSTSITCTALSRDAKALVYLRALPVAPRTYLLAKLAHGLFYALFGSVVGGVGTAIILGLDAVTALLSVFVALSFSALFNLAGLWIDTANPKLSWDNPVAAMKQNPNAVIAILGTMALIGGLGGLSTILPLGVAGFSLVYGGGALVVFASLLAAYVKYAGSRLESLEL